MRSLLVILFFLASISFQAQSVSRDAVTSGGAIMDNGAYSLSISIGQISVATLEQTELILTQGFQQPENHCFGDFNGDGDINTADLLILLGDFDCSLDCSTDLDGDSMVNTNDLLLFLGVFGTSCN